MIALYSKIIVSKIGSTNIWLSPAFHSSKDRIVVWAIVQDYLGYTSIQILIDRLNHTELFIQLSTAAVQAKRTGNHKKDNYSEMQDSVFLSLKQNPFHFPIDLNVPQWERQITTTPRFSPFRTLSSSPELDRSNMFLISGLLIWLLHPSPALPAFPTFLSVFFVWFSHSSFDFDSVGSIGWEEKSVVILIHWLFTLRSTL